MNIPLNMVFETVLNWERDWDLYPEGKARTWLSDLVMELERLREFHPEHRIHIPPELERELFGYAYRGEFGEDIATAVGRIQTAHLDFRKVMTHLLGYEVVWGAAGLFLS